MRPLAPPPERPTIMLDRPASDTLDRAHVAAMSAAITCVAVVGIGLSLSIPLLSLEMERMGVSSTVIGINTALAGLASIVTVPFVPRLAARIGVVRLLILAIFIGAASLIGFKLLHDIRWWFPLRFVFSATLGVLFVLSEFWINEVAPPARRGLVMGIYATVLALGFAVGPTLLVLIGTQGYAPYCAGAALFLLGTVPIALARGLSPEIEGSGSRGVLGYVRLAPAAIFAALVYGAVETGDSPSCRSTACGSASMRRAPPGSSACSLSATSCSRSPSASWPIGSTVAASSSPRPWVAPSARL